MKTALITKKNTSSRRAKYFVGLLLAIAGLSYGLAVPLRHLPGLAALANGGSKAARVKRTKAPAFFFVGPNVTAVKSHSPVGPFHLGDTITYSTTISNSGSDATTVSFSDTPDANTTLVAGSLQASPVAVNDSYSATGNVEISVPAGSGVLANDFPGLNPGATIAAFDATSANGGTVVMTTSGANAGAFTYNPPAGFTGSDTFTYTLTNSVGSSIGTVTITVSSMVWFINNAAGVGDGRLQSPFNSLAAFQAVNNGVGSHPKSGDAIFIYQGTGNYTGPLTLLSNQKVTGQGDALTSTTLGFTPAANSLALPGATAKPTLTGTVTLATGVTVLGFDLSTGAGNGMVGSGGLSGVTVGDSPNTATNGLTVTTTTGTAVSLNNVGGTFTFRSITSNGANPGISLTSTTGSFTVTGDGTNTANGSGGTIQATNSGTSVGISLNNAQSVSLTAMHVHDFGLAAINGSTVTGFTMAYCTIDGTNGSTSGTGEQDSVQFANLLGSASIDHSSISGGSKNTMNVTNTTGTLDRMSVTNSTIALATTAASGNDGFQFTASPGATTMNLTVDNSTFTSARADLMNVGNGGTTALDLVFTNNALSNNNTSIVSEAGGAGGGFNIEEGGGAQTPTITFNISNNTFRDALENAITLGKGSGPGTLHGTINSNTIGVASVNASATQQGSAIGLNAVGSGTVTLDITNNLIQEYAQNGMTLDITQGSATANLTITGNTVKQPADSGTNLSFAVDVEIGALAGDTNTGNVLISGNTLTGNNIGNALADVGVDNNAPPTTHFNLSKGTCSTCTTAKQVIDTLNTVDASPFDEIDNGAGTVTLVTTTPPTAPTQKGAVAASAAPVSTNAPVGGGTNPPADASDTLRAVKGENADKDQAEAAKQQPLAVSDLSWIAQAAIARWQDAGISFDDVMRLQAVKFEISDLPGDQLAVTTGNTVQVDINAAGYGWYVDPAPKDDSKFTLPIFDQDFQADLGSAPFGHIDLLTAIMHAYGRILGKDEEHAADVAQAWLMKSWLSTGTRRVPSLGAVRWNKIAQSATVKPTVAARNSQKQSANQSESAGLASLSVQESSPRAQYAVYSRSAGNQPMLMPASFHGAKPRRAVAAMSPAMFFVPPVNVFIGTLPAGKNVIVKFQVTVNNPLTSPATASSVSNTGSVSGTNFTTVSTNTDTAQLCVPPVVTTPITNQQAAQGTTATFTTVLTGSAPFTSVWKKNGTVLVSGTSLGGRATITNSTVGSSTTSTLTISNTVLTDADTYTVDSADLAACGDTVPTQTATLTVVQPPTLSKAFGASTIPTNGSTSLTLTLHNPNAAINLTGIGFSDNMPAGMQVANPAGIAATCAGTWNATPGDTTLNFGGGTLNASQSCTVSVNITGTTAGAKNNTANAPASNEAGTGVGSNTATLTVVAPPTLSKVFGAASIPLDNVTTTTLTFTISNAAANTTATLSGTTFNDTLPTGLKLNSTTITNNNCPGTPTITATVNNPPGTPSTVSFSGGTLPVAPSSCHFTVTVIGVAAGTQHNTTGTISSTEGGTGTTASANIDVVAPPTIAKTFLTNPIALNATTQLQFTITNPAANAVALAGVAFSDTLPTGLTVPTNGAGVTQCGGTLITTSPTGILLANATIATNSTCQFSVTVTGAASGNYTNTTGNVSSTNGGVNFGAGGTASANLTVAAPATVTKTFAPTKISLNGTTLLTINITNSNSNVQLNGLSFTDSLPAGLVVASPANLNDTCGGTATATAGSGTVSLSGGTLASSASCAVSVNVKGTTAGDKLNSVTVSSTEGGTSTAATATVTVVAPPSISKAFNPTSIPKNGTSTVTFTISNPNNPGTPANGDLTGVAFSDTLPVSSGAGSATLVVSGTPNVSNTCGGTVTATAGSGVISLSGASVAHNTSCTLSVDVKGTVEGDGNNTTGAISSTEGGTGLASNTATLKVVVPPTISKAFGATNITLNGTTTVTFTITNPASNTSAENGITFGDTLTNGLLVASTPGVSNSCGGTVTGAANIAVIGLTGGSIATPGSTCTIVVNVTGTQSGTVTNTTNAVTSTNGGTGQTSNTATLIVASPATVTKTFAPTKIALNGTTLLTINITNPNSNVSLTGLSFTDSLPAGLVVASPANLNNTCGGTATATPASGTVSLSGGTLASSASCAVSVNVQGTTAGDKLNSVTVSSTEGGASSGASATVTVVAPPTFSKHFGHATVPLNQSDTLSFTLTNPNTASALSGIAFTDTLPGGLKLASSTVTGSCGSGTITATINNPPGTPSTVSLSGGTLTASPAPGSSCTFSVSITGMSAGAQVNTTSTVSSTEGGTGGTAGDTITVVGPPTTTKVFNPTTIGITGTSTMTITITNPSATVGLTGVGFTDTFPANLVVANPNGFSNTCNGTPSATAGSGTVSLTGGTIAANSSCAFTVNVTSSVSGSYLNSTGPVSSTEGGNGAAASATLAVASPPVLAIAFNPTTVVLNGTSTLTFTITNPSANSISLSSVGVNDTLPAGLTVPPSITSNPCGLGSGSLNTNGNVIVLGGVTLPPNGQCVFSVTITGTTAGGHTNTTGNVNSAEGGGGNTATASLTVSQASTSTGVASSVNPSIFGQSVTFTATVTNTSPGSTGAPTGSVQFVVDGVNFGSPVALSGATSTTSTATSGATATLSVAGSAHTVTANYINGDGNFTNSTNSLSGGQIVTQAITNTAVNSSANPSVVGQSVTFTATVVDVSAGSVAQPTGSVQFVVDGVNFGSPVTLTGASSNSSTATSQATATLSISGSPHSVTANYVNADGNFINSTGSLSGGQVVNKDATTTAVTSSAGTITLGDTVTFTATVNVNSPGTGIPTGIVTFFDGTTPIGNGKLNALNPDQTTFSTALLAVGSHSITAVYNGDANFTASPLSAPATETVNLRGTTTALILNPTTVGAGQSSTATVTVTDGGASAPPGTPDVFTATAAPAGRTGFTATLFADGAVVVVGGQDANNVVLNTAEVYAGGSFTPTPGNLNTARTGAVAVLLPNGKVLIAGGSSDGTANGALNSAELLDLNSGTFAPTSQNMTAARFGTTATLLSNGKILLAGGSNSGGSLNSAELYDPATDTFTATGNLNALRTGASATLLGSGKVLVAGGSSDGTANGALSSAEVFDPTGNAGVGTFTSVAGANPTLAAGRWQPESALLSSGKVLIAGGQNSGGALTSADLYDPAADSFTATAHQMNEARANGSAVSLPNGMVLLPGGTTSQSVDLYDADGDKFNLTGSLQQFDNGLVATQLNNGQVLVVGLTTAATPASDAELYSPSFNPIGTVALGSSEPTDVFGAACVLAPSTNTVSTCTSTVTPVQVATSPHTTTSTYPADAVHSGSNNSASLTVIPTAPPTISKAFSQNNVAQNGTVGVIFTISNPSAAASLSGISFTDALPAGLVVATPNNLVSNCGGTFTAVPGSSSLSLTGGSLGPPAPPPIAPIRKTSGRPALPSPVAAGQCVITVDLLVTGTGTISNTTGSISANESGPGVGSNTANLQVVLAPTVNKAFGAVSIPLNGTTSLTFNIANPNANTTLVGMALSDTLPNGLVVASPNGLTGTCVSNANAAVTAAPGSNSIGLSSLNLTPGNSCSFSVNVKGTAGGTKNNTTSQITGTFDDGSGTFRVATGGTASASIVVVAPPSIAKAFAPAAIAPGGVSTLSFTITNPVSNTVSLAGVGFTDTLPANLVVATPNGATGNCNGGTLAATAGSGSITLTGGSIPAGNSCVISVNVTTSVPAIYTNTTGAVSSTNGGTGNTASANLSVIANPSIAKAFGAATLPVGSTTSLTLTINNPDPFALTGVAVTDTLPFGLVIATPNGLTNTCGGTATAPAGGSTISLSGGTVAGSMNCTVVVNVTAIAGGTQVNVTGNVSSTNGGTGNTATASVNVPGPPLTINLTVSGGGNVTINPGDTATFVFTVNSGTPALGPINFSCNAPLPAGATCTFTNQGENQNTAQVTLNFATTGPSAPTTASNQPQQGRGTAPLAALLLPVFGVVGLTQLRRGKKGKNLRLRIALWLGGMLLLLVMAGCGGHSTSLLSGNGNGGTPPGLYPITVTATSSANPSITATANVTVTVR